MLLGLAIVVVVWSCCVGTVATISDPHEIANVCGIEGVQFMIENGKTVPFKFNFGAPSCVPATTFETAGAALLIELDGVNDGIDDLLQEDNPEDFYGRRPKR